MSIKQLLYNKGFIKILYHITKKPSNTGVFKGFCSLEV